MNNYTELIILSDPEFPATILMNAVYSKLHKALFDLNSNSIGVSFPNYKVTLGVVLRLHGSQSDLATLQQKNWLGGMSGYCKVSEIKPVPENSQHRTIRRKQTTMSQAKLNRLLKRDSISPNEAKSYRAKMFTKGLNNPYLELRSGSTGHKHRRYIEFGELVDKPVLGVFDQFGFSKTATIPWFD